MLLAGFPQVAYMRDSRTQPPPCVGPGGWEQTRYLYGDDVYNQLVEENRQYKEALKAQRQREQKYGQNMGADQYTKVEDYVSGDSDDDE